MWGNLGKTAFTPEGDVRGSPYELKKLSDKDQPEWWDKRFADMPFFMNSSDVILYYEPIGWGDKNMGFPTPDSPTEDAQLLTPGNKGALGGGEVAAVDLDGLLAEELLGEGGDQHRGQASVHGVAVEGGVEEVGELGVEGRVRVGDLQGLRSGVVRGVRGCWKRGDRLRPAACHAARSRAGHTDPHAVAHGLPARDLRPARS